MNQQDQYLGSDTEGTYTGQITRLLRDTSTDNCPLLLELIDGGGANRRLLGYLFGISVFHAAREISGRAMGLLQRFASAESVKQAQKLRESAAYHYDEAEYFRRYQSAEIDLFDLLLASKMCLWHRHRPGPGSNAMVAHQTLDLRRLTVNHLSPALTTLDFLRFVALPAHKDFDLPNAIPLLLQLPLEILIVENIKVETLPVALFALPGLTTFIIRKGTYRPKYPMQVPDDGPYGSPSLEKLIIEGYPIEGEMHLGPFPNLREATLVRCSLTHLDFLQQSPKLERLNVRFNQLEYLPAFLSGCTELRSLELSNNPFRKIELNLEPLRNLEELDLKMQTRLPGNFRLSGGR